MNAPRLSLLLLALVGCLAVPTSARGWLVSGHEGVGRWAVRVLPEEVPAFFREGVEGVANCAADPDFRKIPGMPALTARESPEHYIDIENFAEIGLPDTRSALMQRVIDLGVPYEKLGFAPWAIVEGTEALTLAFAEYRRWPEDEAIRWKTLVYAGNLSHYAADLCQPLHTTIDHDGRALPDGSSPRTGIHFRVDGWITPFARDPGRAVEGIVPREIEALFPAVVARLHASHALVDRVYELDASGDEVATNRFAQERFRDSVSFVADLFLTAWRRSAELELPGWAVRLGPGERR